MDSYNKEFSRKLSNMVAERKICAYCNDPAQTLHHIDENHKNNGWSNLIPICHRCHLEIPHKSDLENFDKTQSV